MLFKFLILKHTCNIYGHRVFCYLVALGGIYFLFDASDGEVEDAVNVGRTP